MADPFESPAFKQLSSRCDCVGRPEVHDYPGPFRGFLHGFTGPLESPVDKRSPNALSPEIGMDASPHVCLYKRIQQPRFNVPADLPSSVFGDSNIGFSIDKG